MVIEERFEFNLFDLIPKERHEELRQFLMKQAETFSLQIPNTFESDPQRTT